MKRFLTAIALILAWALIAGGMDRRDAWITARHERAAAEKKADVTPEEQVELMKHQLNLPMGCSQWIAKCGSGEICRARYTCAADLTKRTKK